MSSSNQCGPSKRTSRGRQKVSMVKMANQSNLQVTFSKRRAGLFKKASELCTLCGAEAAIVVFSPADKAYCFGHPNLNTLLDRVSEDAPPTNSRSQLVMEAHRNSTIRQLNMELTQAEGLLRAEKRRAQEIEAASKVDKMTCPPLEGLSYAQLCMLNESIEGLKKKFDAKVVQKQTATFSGFHHHEEKTDGVTKLSLGSSEPGFYSAGCGLFGPSGSTWNAPLVSDDYGMFGYVGGSNMLPGGNGFGFSLGHDDHPPAGFF